MLKLNQRSITSTIFIQIHFSSCKQSTPQLINSSMPSFPLKSYDNPAHPEYYAVHSYACPQVQRV